MNKIKGLSKWLLAAVICRALYKEVGKWEDDLIWCPSQCFLNFKIGKRFFVLYLRWRWEDPWSADLISTNTKFNLQAEDAIWYSIDIDYFTESDDLDKLKKHSIRKAIQKIAHGI